MDKNVLYNVTNRSDGIVVYKVPDLNVRREFQRNETKQIPYGELEALYYLPGGKALMQQYLQIQSNEALKQLNVKVEPEYHMSVAEIKELMTNGSLDAFLDCLDFAPAGVLDIIKRLSVELPLNDFNKRKAILDKMGFDVTKALANVEAEKAVSNEPAPEQKQRRVAAPTPKATTPTRRTK